MPNLARLIGSTAAILATALVVVAAFVGTASADTAGATSASLTMVSEPGDEVGQGLPYSYSTPGTLFYAYSDGTLVHILARSPSWDDWWYLDFAAPPGERLHVGSYTEAAWVPFRQAGQPGLSVGGEGRGCGSLVGNFQVIDVEYGPLDTVQRFHATFEQRCSMEAPALRGEVELVNHPWRPPLEITLNVDARGSKRGGNALVHGTISCNAPGTTVGLSVAVTQDDPLRPVFGEILQDPVACDPTPTAWSAKVESFNCRDHPSESGQRYTCYPFLPGSAEVSVRAYAFDPTYQLEGEVEGNETATVVLRSSSGG